MTTPTLFLIDLAAIIILTFGLYFPRHHRKDLVVAFIAVNLGVVAVANALAHTGASAGLGLGLFGVLSIIRLRSAELDQREVAYFFASLALGLLGGLAISPAWLTPAWMATVVVAIGVADHPALWSSYRRQVITLDRAFTDEAALTTYLGDLLDADVRSVTIDKVDLVRDTTTVDVRYKYRAPAGHRRVLGTLDVSRLDGSHLDGSHESIPADGA